MFEVGQWLDPGYDKSIVDHFPLMFSFNLINFTYAVGFLQYTVVNNSKLGKVYTAPSLKFSLFFALRNKIQETGCVKGSQLCVFPIGHSVLLPWIQTSLFQQTQNCLQLE